MRIAIISDIHANYEALKILRDHLKAADKVIALGDFVGYYCQVNEVLGFLRDLDPLCLLGNHDDFLLHGCPDSENDCVRFGIEYADRVIDPDHRRWLSTLPLVWGGRMGGRSLLLSHGSPWRPLSDYLYADQPAVKELLRFDYDVIAFGQTHRSLLRTEKRPWRVNPGSVGQSRHKIGRACLAEFDTNAMTMTPIELPYDSAPVLAQARQAGAGEWIEKYLL